MLFLFPQPVDAAPGRDDLHDVAGLELGRQRNEAAVDLGTAAAMANFSMNVVRKINGGRSGW